MSTFDQSHFYYPHSSTSLKRCNRRYGELEDVKSILDRGVNINYQDAHGNTALHLSCANGHAGVTRELLVRGAAHLPNGAGNRPLHWAIQNKHKACAVALLEVCPESSQINVLDQNEFGKSALSNAFMTADADLVKLILTHKSAEEDMLLSQSSLGKGGQKNKPNSQGDDYCGAGGGERRAGTDGTTGIEREEHKEGPSVVHKLVLDPPEGWSVVLSSETEGNDEEPIEGKGGGGDGIGDEKVVPKTVLVRELPIPNADECFGDQPEEDTTGLGVWGSAVVLARWIASPDIRSRLQGLTVVELGAGCGASSIAAAVYCNPACVVATDLNFETVANLEHNVKLNQDRYSTNTKIHAARLSWDDESTWEDARALKADIILGADLVYQGGAGSALMHALVGLLKPGGTFLHVAPMGDREGLEGFLEGLTATCGSEEGGGGGAFELVQAVDAPEDFRSNPLLSRSEADYLLHFTDLNTFKYRLHEFRRQV
ncbi:unnamed protein product [Choristocarpus tenellus]